MNHPDNEWRSTHEHLRMAEIDAMAACRAALPVGRFIWYKVGNTSRHGMIVRVEFFDGYRNGRAIVKQTSDGEIFSASIQEILENIT